jgi:hypothetical protein
MNQIAERTERLPMDSVGVSNTSTGSKIAPQTLAEVVKFAEVMCRADIALPKHLRGNTGACMAVAMQALEWQLSPFAVASKSYAVNGAIAYEAQLIAAVVNTRSGIKGRLKYAFEGEGGALTCTVTGTLDGEDCVYTSPPIGSITTKNSPLWKSDPQQQLGYFSARSWARRHCPEVILGVYDRDEAEEFRGPDNARDVTPTPSVMERLQAAQNTPERTADEVEGFSAVHVQRETASVLTGEIFTPDTDDTNSLPVSGSDDETSPAQSSDDQPAPAASSQESAEQAQPSPAAADSSLFKFDYADGELIHLKDFARKALDDAAGANDAPAKEVAIERLRLSYLDAVESEDGRMAINGMLKAIAAVINGRKRADASAYIAREFLDCDPSELGGRS